MKTFSAALSNHYQQAVTQLAEGWRVTQATTGDVYGWTTSDLDVTIDGVLYRASQGLTPSSAHTTNDLSVDSLDISVFMDVSTELEITAGVWDEAAVVHFEYVWSDPPTAINDTVHVKRTGTLGRIQRKNLVLTAEIRGLADVFQTRIGRQYSPICPWRHGIWAVSTYVASIECQADLAGLGFIYEGSLTAVGTDATIEFSDSANPNPDDATPNTYYEAGGQVTMTSGANAGITREVLKWTSKTFTLLRPFPYPVEVGDTYSALRGDAHDYPTCLSFYLNVVNFGGFPSVPGQDSAYSTPTGV